MSLDRGRFFLFPWGPSAGRIAARRRQSRRGRSRLNRWRRARDHPRALFSCTAGSVHQSEAGTSRNATGLRAGHLAFTSRPPRAGSSGDCPRWAGIRSESRPLGTGRVTGYTASRWPSLGQLDWPAWRRCLPVAVPVQVHPSVSFLARAEFIPRRASSPCLPLTARTVARVNRTEGETRPCGPLSTPSGTTVPRAMPAKGYSPGSRPLRREPRALS